MWRVWGWRMFGVGCRRGERMVFMVGRRRVGKKMMERGMGKGGRMGNRCMGWGVGREWDRG